MATNGTFSRVLCWVDGSDEACRAAEHAALLARRIGAELSFVAVGNVPESDAGYSAYARIEGVSEPMPPIIGSDVTACLEQAMSISARVGVKGATRLTQSGAPIAAICDAARRQNADLVVIRKQRSNLVERLIGESISEKFSRQCNFAVLLVG